MRRYIIGFSLFLSLIGQTGSAFADITIGLAGPLTGKQAIFGDQIRRGAEQAVKDINAAGGIHGEKLQLKVVDDACDPKQAVAVANQLVSAGIKYVIGHYCSGSAIPASKVYMDEGVLFITPAATNPKLTDEAKDLVFRVCGRDDRQGEVIGLYLVNHFKGKRIAIAQDETAYGRGLADVVQSTLHQRGVTEVLFEAYTPGERDYSPLISKINSARADVLFLGGYHTEAGLIARQLKEQKVAVPLVGGDALVTDEIWAIAGNSAEGMMMTFGPDPRLHSEAKTVIEELRQSNYEPEGYTLYTYAAFEVLKAGLLQASNPTEAMSVARELRKGALPTVLGPLSFDSKGDIRGPAYVMYRWHDGKYSQIGD